MKCIKKFIVMFALLLCVIPSNIVLADESDISLAFIAGTCPKCGNNTLDGTKVIDSPWMDTGDDGPECQHGYAYGFDVPQLRYYHYHYVCSSCKYTFNSIKFIEKQKTCKGYN